MNEKVEAQQDWLERQRIAISDTELSPDAFSLGRVERIGDGIASVSGLPDVKLNELLKFENNRLGFALTLDADDIGAWYYFCGQFANAFV